MAFQVLRGRERQSLPEEYLKTLLHSVLPKCETKDMARLCYSELKRDLELKATEATVKNTSFSWQHLESIARKILDCCSLQLNSVAMTRDELALSYMVDAIQAEVEQRDATETKGLTDSQSDCFRCLSLDVSTKCVNPVTRWLQQVFENRQEIAEKLRASKNDQCLKREADEDDSYESTTSSATIQLIEIDDYILPDVKMEITSSDIKPEQHKPSHSQEIPSKVVAQEIPVKREEDITTTLRIKTEDFKESDAVLQKPQALARTQNEELSSCSAIRHSVCLHFARLVDLSISCSGSKEFAVTQWSDALAATYDRLTKIRCKEEFLSRIESLQLVNRMTCKLLSGFCNTTSLITRFVVIQNEPVTMIVAL